MKFNYDIFKQQYEHLFGKLKNDNVRYIIDQNETYGVSLDQLAYILATAYHETRHDFTPKREYGSAKYFIKLYWENIRVRGWLGNDSTAEAVKYCGRGLVQITGENNYEKYHIADNPDKALELDTATHILYDGMTKGVFSGASISQYINQYKTDFIKARKVVNGIDDNILISGYADKFKLVLERSLNG